jgi:hypothetical protein
MAAADAGATDAGTNAAATAGTTSAAPGGAHDATARAGAYDEGGSIKLYADDAKRNHEEVSRWSKKDADAMPRWDAWLAGLADVLGPLLLTVPPRLGSHKPTDLASAVAVTSSP